MHKIPCWMMAVILAFPGLGLAGSFQAEAGPDGFNPGPAIPAAQEMQALSLEDCIRIALDNNSWRQASQFALEMAKAQHQQALSSWWPHLSARSSFMQMDEDPNFLFPKQSFTFNLPLLSVPIPVSIPSMDIKMMDKTSWLSSLSLSFPLYTGGLRGSIIKQAKSGIEAATQEVRRTDLQVLYDVKRLYYACLLAENLRQIAKDTLARLEVTLSLTENLYTKGSGRVKKTDYLRNKMVVETVRSILAAMESNLELARAALVNSMGLPWEARIALKKQEIPYEPYKVGLNQLVTKTYAFNPDWGRLEAGLAAAQAKVGEARSGYLPKFGLVGSLNYLNNSYSKGMATPQNKTSWMVGVGLEIPLFDGFLTAGRLREARARVKKMEQQQVLLQEGLALQVKHIFLFMDKAQKQHDSSKAALQAATENRELNVRAYQDELVETKDVIESQIMESFMQAQFQKVLYDHIEAQAHLDFVIGEEVLKLFR